MKLTKPLAIALTTLLIATTSALADDHDKKEHGEHGERSHEGNSEHHDKEGDHDRSKSEISVKEREAIQAWYESRGPESKKSRRLPPGLAKKAARDGKLPPGWQDKLVKGQPIPVEIYAHCEPLPKEIAIKLPVPPVGTVLVTVEGKAARILEATHEILDIFDVLPKPPMPKGLPRP